MSSDWIASGPHMPSDVRQALVAQIRPIASPILKGSPPLERWLSRLSSDEDALRMAACYCVDVSSGSIDADKAATVLGLWIEADDPRSEFCTIVDDPTRALLLKCCSRFSGPVEGEQLIRIMELSRFIDYYAGPTFGYSSTNPRDVLDVLDTFFGVDSDSTLDDITTVWTGGRDRVWVSGYRFLLDHFEDVAGGPPTQWGTLLNDALGLGYAHGASPGGLPILVGVVYPPGFAVATAQPTVFDAFWEGVGGFYLSWHNSDGWGRTHSCSGTLAGCKERVHEGFSARLAGFTAVTFGESQSVTIDRSSLLVDALERLKQSTNP